MLQDVRYGLRMLRNSPGFTATAVIALMLGIASTTVIFSVVDGILLHPLPFPDSDRIVTVSQALRSTGASEDASSPANYLDWVAQNQVFSRMAACSNEQANLTDGDRPERVRTAMPTASFFALFGVAPQIGRALLPADEQAGSARVVVLSHALWQRRYGSDPALVGRDIAINGQPYTVVGIMPPGYSPDRYAELWIASPWGVPTNSIRPTEDPRAFRDSTYLDVWARLKPGVTLQQARAEMTGIAARLEKQFPRENEDIGISIVPLHEDMVGGIRPMLLVLLAAVGSLLAIGCANVANLLLARAATRSREISIRAALGASRSRLIRQMLTESLLLALIGGFLGVVLAAWAMPLLIAMSPPAIRGFQTVGLNREVLAFTFGVSVLTGVLFGSVPAFSASSWQPGHGLHAGDRGNTGSSSRSRSILVVAEVCLSLVLLIGAGLLVKSFNNLMHVDPGFATDRLLIFNIGLPNSADQTQQTNFYREVLERVRALPGVERAGAVSRLPLSGGNSARTFNIAGNSTEQSADIRVSTPDYFATLGIPLLQGRNFNEHDVKGSLPVAIINEAAARTAFAGEDPIGKYILNIGPKSEKLQIVGVVGNVRHLGLHKAPRPEIYQPLGQAIWPSVFVAIRTAAANPLTLLPSVQNAVWSVNKDVPLGNVRTMQDVIAGSVMQRKFTMLLLTLFAGLALVLAAIGLYGVISYSVSQRTREIGIRMALGAARRDVLNLIVRQGMLLTSAGVVVGILASLGVTRLLSNLLFGVSATDISTFVALSLLLALIALFACWLPARRASSVDPMIALRAE
jgi:putative ABC transport system permease protein